MDENTTPQGVDRRTVLRRGALLGGALIWTTPVVQSLGGTALAATGTPNGTGETSCADISYVVIFIKCDGLYYAYKMGRDATDQTRVYQPFLITGDDNGNGGAEGFVRAESQAYGGAITTVQSSDPAYPLFTATGNADGDLIIQFTLDPSTQTPECTLVSFYIHDGQVHGGGPGVSHVYAYGDENLPISGWEYPAVPSTGEIKFVKPGNSSLTCDTTA